MGGGVFIPTLVPPKNSALTKHIAAHLYYTNLHSPGMSGAGASRHCKKISDRQKQKAMQTAEENGGLGNHKQDYIMNLAQRIPNDRLLRELCERAYKVKLQRQEVAAAAKNAAIAKTLMTAAKKQQKVQRKQKIDKDAYKLCRMGLTGKTEAMTGHTSRLSSAMRSEGAGDRSGEKQNDKKRKKTQEKERDDEEEEEEEDEGSSADNDGEDVVVMDTHSFSFPGGNIDRKTKAVLLQKQRRAEEKAREKEERDDPMLELLRQEIEDRKEASKEKAKEEAQGEGTREEAGGGHGCLLGGEGREGG